MARAALKTIDPSAGPTDPERIRARGQTGDAERTPFRIRIQRDLVEAINRSPRSVTQQARSQAMRTAPSLIAQRARIEHAVGPGKPSATDSHQVVVQRVIDDTAAVGDLVTCKLAIHAGKVFTIFSISAGAYSVRNLANPHETLDVPKMSFLWDSVPPPVGAALAAPVPAIPNAPGNAPAVPILDCPAPNNYFRLMRAAGRVTCTFNTWWTSPNFQGQNIEMRVNMDGAPWGFVHVKWHLGDAWDTDEPFMATLKAGGGPAGASVPNGNIFNAADSTWLRDQARLHGPP